MIIRLSVFFLILFSLTSPLVPQTSDSTTPTTGTSTGDSSTSDQSPSYSTSVQADTSANVGSSDPIVSTEPTGTPVPADGFKPEEGVSNSGDFTYSFPLALPPGTNGLTPKLTLVYNSSRGNGPLGLGFYIPELKTISRDSTFPIKFGPDDQFALNGEKLIPEVVNDPNGNKKLRYHLQHDNFERIELKNDNESSTDKDLSLKTFNGQTPNFVGENFNATGAYWVLRRTDGITETYGQLAANRFNAPKSTNVHTWPLDSVTDRFGNKYTITYVTDSSTGAYYPNFITYPRGLGGTKSYVVRFCYETRTDHFPSFNPWEVDTRLRLSMIAIYATDTESKIDQMIRTYRLNYTYDPGNGQSRLATIKDFGKAGTIPDKDLSPATATPAPLTSAALDTPISLDTTFSWTSAGTTWVNRSFPIDSTISSSMAMSTGDFDGDGLTDLIFTGGTKAVLARNQGGAKLKTYPMNFSFGLPGVSAFDYNNDAKDDLVSVDGKKIYSNIGSKFYTGTENWTSALITTDTISNWSVRSGVNLDRDETPDLLLVAHAPVLDQSLPQNDPGKLKAYKINKTGKVDSSTFSIPGFANSYFDTGDFNGDGLTDIAILKNNNLTVLFCQDSTPETLNFSSYSVTNLAFSALRRLTCGDLNGDGLTDILLYNSNQNSTIPIGYFTSKGNTGLNGTFSGFGYVALPEEPLPSSTSLSLSDFNGDGLTDILAYFSSTGPNFAYPTTQMTWIVALNRGNGQFQKLAGSATQTYNTLTAKSVMGDFDGNGQVDFLFFDGAGTVNYKSLLGGTKPLLTAVTDQASSRTLKITFTSAALQSGAVMPLKGDVPATPALIDAPAEFAAISPLYDTNTYLPSQTVFSRQGDEKTNVKPSIRPKLIPNTRPRLVVSNLSWYAPSNKKLLGYSYSYMNGLRRTGQPWEQADLGFQAVRRVTDGTGQVLLTEYFNLAPYTGMVSRQTNLDAAGNILTQEQTLVTDGGYVTVDSAQSLQLIPPGQSVAIPRMATFQQVTERRQYKYDGLSIGLVRSTSYTYNHSTAYGNPVCETDSGWLKTDTGAPLATHQQIVTEKSWHLFETGGIYLVQPTQTLVKADRPTPIHKAPDFNSQFKSLQEPGTVFTSLTQVSRTTTEYNSVGLPVSQTVWLDDGSGVRTFTEFETNGLPQRTSRPYKISSTSDLTQPSDWATTLAYSYGTSGGLLTRISDALGQNTSYELDLLGLKIKETNLGGLATTTDYDTFGRPTRQIQQNDQESNTSETKISYSVPGTYPVLTTSTVTPTEMSPISQYTFTDALGRKIQDKRTGPADAYITQNWNYDAGGRNSHISLTFLTTTPPATYSSATTDKDGQPVLYHQFTYDDANRPIQVASPDTATTTTSTYTAYRLNKTLSLDENGHLTQSEDNGPVKIVTTYTGTYTSIPADPTPTLYSTTTSLNYPPVSQIIDTIGNTLTVITDPAGLTTISNTPDKGTWTTVKDLAKYQTTVTDAKGNIVVTTTDKLDRPVSVAYNGESPPSTTYEYFTTTGAQKGQLKQVNYTEGQDVFTYDHSGRVASQARTLGGITRTQKTNWTNAGTIKTIQIDAGETVNYSYGTDGQLTGISGNSTYASNFSYNSDGRILNYTNGNDVMMAYTYDPYNRSLTTIKADQTKTPTSLLNLSYTYDKVGNVLTRTDGKNTPNSQSYTYDALNRLTSFTVNSVTSTFEYDRINNITLKDGKTYTYDTTHPHFVATFGTNTYTADANGNTIQRIKNGILRTMSWDAENRLTKITDGGVDIATYSYDAARQRTIETSQTKKTYYFFPGYIETYDLANGKLVDSTQIYTANNLKIAQRKNAGLNYFLADHLGSTSVMTNASGELIMSETSKPFGETLSSSGDATQTQYHFTGQIRDFDTGLEYYNARYYDAELGRFTQADFVLDGLNIYAYCHNNPVRYTDPTGLWGEEAFKGIPSFPEFDPKASSGPPAQAWPIEQGVITSVYGSRSDSGGVQPEHAGIDIVAPKGTPVLASSAGVVTSAEVNQSSSTKSTYIKILNGDGTESNYVHTDMLVKPLQKVVKGQKIGTVGTNGTKIPHLHFEIRKPGGSAKSAKDPIPILDLKKKPKNITIDPNSVKKKNDTLENLSR